MPSILEWTRYSCSCFCAGTIACSCDGTLLKIISLVMMIIELDPIPGAICRHHREPCQFTVSSTARQGRQGGRCVTDDRHCLNCHTPQLLAGTQANRLCPSTALLIVLQLARWARAPRCAAAKTGAALLPQRRYACAEVCCRQVFRQSLRNNPVSDHCRSGEGGQTHGYRHASAQLPHSHSRAVCGVIGPRQQ